MQSLSQTRPGVCGQSPKPQPRRHFLRVPGFDEMQNPRRPKRPTGIKSFVRDLDDPVRVDLSLTVRGSTTPAGVADFAGGAVMRRRYPWP